MTEVDGHSDASDTDGHETELDRLWQEVPRHSYLGGTFSTDSSAPVLLTTQCELQLL